MSWTPHHNEVVYKDSLESIVDAIGGTGIVSGMAVTPGSGSYYINIASGTYKIGGTEYSYAGVTNFTLGPYIPNTTNYYQYVLVSINSSGAVIISESTEASATSDLVMDYTSSSGNCKVATIQLRNGQTTIDSAEILDSARMIIEANLNLSDYVTKSGTQTISGSKTFSSYVTLQPTGTSSNGEIGLLIKSSSTSDGPTWLEFRKATGAANGPVAQIGLARAYVNNGTDISPRLFLGIEESATSFSSSRVTNANRGLHIFENGAILANGGVGEGSATNNTVVYEMNLTSFDDGAQPTWGVPATGGYWGYVKTTNGIEVDTAIIQDSYGDSQYDDSVPNMRINNDGRSLKINRTSYAANMRMVLGAPKSYSFNITFDMYVENKTDSYRGGSITVQCYMIHKTSGDMRRLTICYVGVADHDLVVYGQTLSSYTSTRLQSSGSSTASFNSEIAGEWARVRIDVEAHAAKDYGIGGNSDDGGLFNASITQTTSSSANTYFTASYGTEQIWASHNTILEDYEFMTHMPIEFLFGTNNQNSTNYQDTFYIDNLSIQAKEGYDLR